MSVSKDACPVAIASLYILRTASQSPGAMDVTIGSIGGFPVAWPLKTIRKVPEEMGLPLRQGTSAGTFVKRQGIPSIHA